MSKLTIFSQERNFNIYPEDSDEEEGSAKNMSSTDENLNGDLVTMKFFILIL